jgi:hypothetical protein
MNTEDLKIEVDPSERASPKFVLQILVRFFDEIRDLLPVGKKILSEIYVELINFIRFFQNHQALNKKQKDTFMRLV